MSQSTGGLLSSLDEAQIDIVPVWRGIILQITLMMLVSLVIVVLSEVLDLPPESELSRLLTLALVFVPVFFWLLLAVLPEFRALRPRRRLISVAIVSGLLAAAIGLPVVRDFFRVEEWLPHETAVRRVIGFTLTAGIVDTGLKLLVLRFLIFPNELRNRSDTIAYGLASAIGYSLYLCLELIWRIQPSLGVAAIYVLSNLTIQIASGLFIAVGIAESYFSDALPPVLPINVLIAAIFAGLVTPLTSGLMSGPLGTTGNSDRPLFALVFLMVAMSVSIGLAYFFYRMSERREREAYLGSRDSDGI